MTPGRLLKFSALHAQDPTRSLTVVEEVKSEPLMINELDLKWVWFRGFRGLGFGAYPCGASQSAHLLA